MNCWEKNNIGNMQELPNMCTYSKSRIGSQWRKQPTTPLEEKGNKLWGQQGFTKLSLLQI